MRPISITAGRLVLTGLVLVLAACQTPSSATQTLVGYHQVALHRVAVMPFLPGNTALYADDQVRPPLDCTMLEFCQAVNELGFEAENALTRQMQRAMERRLDTRVVPRTLSTETYEDLPRNPLVDTPRQLARRFGQALGADHVILGSVWRYQERTPEEGASVAFTVYLLEVETGRRVWRGQFDKTQQALTENLREGGVFFEEGARWLAAEELARYGLEQVLKDFPRLAD